jgi:pyruvate dehydrogenase E2 component (dihydrolipoamide acetyltransferase)
MQTVIFNRSMTNRAMTQLIEFKLPELGENIEQGDLVRLMVEPGAPVSAGQSVMELETDKAVVEVPSSVSGTVQEIRVKEGDKIKVGQVIFTVDGAEGKSGSTPVPTAAAAPQAPVEKEPEPAPAGVKREVSPAPTQQARLRVATAQANSDFPSLEKTSRRAILCD